MAKKFIKYEFVPYDGTLCFGRNQENREINRQHLQKIKKQCMESFESMPPISVNAVTNHIIDGQHRLQAYQDLVESGYFPKETTIKVMWLEIPVEEEKSEIIEANCNTKNWGIEDYMTSYAKAGIVSYVRLEEWCKLHPLTSDNGKAKFRYGAAIITGRRCQSVLKSGEFTFTEEEFSRADDVHAELLEIVELLNIRGKGNWIESLAVSWMAVRNQHEFAVWRKEIKAKKHKFMKLPKDNSKDWDNIFAQAHLAIDKKKAA